MSSRQVPSGSKKNNAHSPSGASPGPMSSFTGGARALDAVGNQRVVTTVDVVDDHRHPVDTEVIGARVGPADRRRLLPLQEVDDEAVTLVGQRQEGGVPRALTLPTKRRAGLQTRCRPAAGRKAEIVDIP